MQDTNKLLSYSPLVPSFKVPSINTLGKEAIRKVISSIFSLGVSISIAKKNRFKFKKKIQSRLPNYSQLEVHNK